jgi:membrane protease YdiL (CAAX protease family)
MKMNFYCQAISLISYSLFFFLYWIERTPVYAAAIASFLLVASFFYVPMRQGFELALIVSLTHLLLWSFKFVPYLSWPLDFFMVAGFGFILMRFLFKTKIKLDWYFKFSKRQVLSVALINFPSIAVLLLYFQANREIARQWPLPSIPFWAIPFVVVLIAAVNGLREEIYYRGILQTISSEKYSTWFKICFQAISFGSLHYLGAFPQGWIGVALTAAWGALIALQYHYYRSIALSWLTHSVADAIMFTVIIVTR